MKNKHLFKHIYFSTCLFILSLTIGTIANGFSKWVFDGVNNADINLTGKVFSDDIEENYQFDSGTTSNEFNTYKRPNNNQKDYFYGKYEYKLLGGYNSDNTKAFDYNNVASERTFKEVNFKYGSGNYSAHETVDQGLGRLFYIDRVYFPAKNSSNRNVIENINCDLNDGNGSQVISLNLNRNGFAIARQAVDGSSTLDTNNINNWITIIDQDDEFKKNYVTNKIYGDYISGDYKYMKKNVAKVNEELETCNLNYYFEQGDSYKRSDEKDSDYISRFNGNEKDVTKETTSANFYISSSTYSISDSKSAHNTIRSKLFTNSGSYDYYNVLLFIPFVKDYSSEYGGLYAENYESSVGNTITTNRVVDGNIGFVALYPSTKSLSTSIKSFLKVIDYTDIENSDLTSGDKVLPTVLNDNAYSYSDDNYIDLKKNFIDDGNLFIDNLNKDTNNTTLPTYRRVYGITNNYKDSDFGSEPNAPSSSTYDHALGNTIEYLYANYGAEWYDSTVDLNEAKLDTYQIALNQFMNANIYTSKPEYKFLDHLTLEEVSLDVIYDYVVTSADETTGLKTYEKQDNGRRGIYFNKSMILLLVRKDLEISFESLTKSRSA